MGELRSTIESSYEKYMIESPQEAVPEEQAEMVREAISQIDRGELRVCIKTDIGWQTQAWVKKAILLYFKVSKMTPMQVGLFHFVDKIPLKSWSGNEGVRVVPPSITRYGSYVESGAILMPSYVNIGAYIGTGSMIDTWATIGSCAQIGSNVHVSGGVGIGGVLEPAQADPVIIEDNCFIGSRCIVVEGARIEEGAVLGAGVTITGSTKIIDVTQSEPVTHIKRVPKYSVVIPGSVEKSFPSGNYSVPAALIIGQRQQSTDKKVSLNKALRDFDVSV